MFVLLINYVIFICVQKNVQALIFSMFRHFDIPVGKKQKNREYLEKVFFHCICCLAYLNEENSTWLVIM